MCNSTSGNDISTRHHMWNTETICTVQDSGSVLEPALPLSRVVSEASGAVPFRVCCQRVIPGANWIWCCWPMSSQEVVCSTVFWSWVCYWRQSCDPRKRMWYYWPIPNCKMSGNVSGSPHLFHIRNCTTVSHGDVMAKWRHTHNIGRWLYRHARLPQHCRLQQWYVIWGN